MKYAWIDTHRDQYSVSRLCRILDVSRSGYCQWRCRGASKRARANAALDVAVSTIHRASRGSYGRPRIVRQLREQGQSASAERVRRSLLRLGLRPVYKRPYRVTTDSAHRLPVAPNLLDRRFNGWTLDRAWVSDITFVRTSEGWLYLAVVLDLFARTVVGWSMSSRIDSDLVLNALLAAVWRRRPKNEVIIHSDQGSQFGSHDWRDFLKTHKLKPSMSRRGNCHDNTVAESFFQLLKRERIRRRVYTTREQARADIFDYIEMFYNPKRRHGHAGEVSPVEFERRHFLKTGTV